MRKTQDLSWSNRRISIRYRRGNIRRVKEETEIRQGKFVAICKKN